MQSGNGKAQEEGIAPPPDGQLSPFRDFVGGLLMLVVSLTFGIAAVQIPFKNSSWEWYTSPGIFALAMSLCLGACGLVVACRGLRGWFAERGTAHGSFRESLRTWGMARFLAAVGIILVYLLLLGRVPFLLASAGLILVFGTVFREGNMLGGVRPSLIAAAVIAIFSFVIMRVFGIVFP